LQVNPNQLQLALASYHRSGRGEGLDPPLDSVAPIDVVALTSDVYAFAAQWGATGTIFLASRRDGEWAVVWDIRKADVGRFSALKAWRTDHARAGCEDEKGQSRFYDCGPLYGVAFPVKPDAQGRARFGVSATYAQGVGFTVTSQISFWRWDGTKAEPLFGSTYVHEEDDIARGLNAADTVVVRVKEDYRSFEACGACNGRQYDWTFRVLPDRIEDGGKRLVHPEADFIDAVYADLQDHKPVAAAGTPQALALMERHQPSRGDLVTWPNSAGADVCLFSDAFDTFDIHFKVVRRNGGYFIAKATQIPAKWNKPHCARQVQPAAK
jgi:hypothetical protein